MCRLILIVFKFLPNDLINNICLVTTNHVHEDGFSQYKKEYEFVAKLTSLSKIHISTGTSKDIMCISIIY